MTVACIKDLEYGCELLWRGSLHGRRAFAKNLGDEEWQDWN